MKKYLTAAALALLMTTAAQAKIVNLGTNGAWSNEYYTDEGNGGLCGMTTSWHWQNGAIGLVQFKWQNGHWFTHITKSNWRIPSKTEIPTAIWFDNGSRSAVGSVLDDQRGGSTIEVGFDIDTEGFLSDVGNAAQMKITFDGGNEPAWVTKTMNGSRKAVAVMLQCINWVKNNAPTQPGAQSRTQPAPAPTQPGGVKPVGKKDDGSV